MKVRMKIHIAGVRDGRRWPSPGDVIDLPDQEAAAYIDQGYCEAVDDEPPPTPSGERAVRRPRGEKR